MKPFHSGIHWISMVSALAFGTVAMLGGCHFADFRGQSPDDAEMLEEGEETADLILNYAFPTGLGKQQVQYVGLVKDLASTGSDPPPTPERQALIDAMQTHKVSRPNDILSWPSTSLVTVKGVIPPGAQKGDRFDVVVTVPRRSETTSLRGGWLMPTRLREVAVINGSAHSSLQLALARGPVLVESIFEGGDDELLEKRGRILGGGIVGQSRPLGLAIRSEKGSVTLSTLISKAINRRFHRKEHGIKTGVAEPKRDNYVELAIEPRYRHNLSRYLRVVRAIPLRQNSAEMPARFARLEELLYEPATAGRAALMLEAIGPDSTPTLLKGIQSTDPETRFYAAEALAYLDVEQAAGPLAEAAANEPAFRWHALAALAAMDHVAAYDELTELLHDASAETRYGAFYALRQRNPNDPLIGGERMKDGYNYHVIATSGEPLIHFTRYKRAEVVVYGHQIEIVPPKYLFAGKSILIKGTDDGQLKVTRFQAGGASDKHETCAADLNSMIRAIDRLGGGYAEIMAAVRAAKDQGDLKARVIVDAIPRTRRNYNRDESTSDKEEPRFEAANPTPELFSNYEADEGKGSKKNSSTITDQTDESSGGFLSTMGGLFGG